MCSHLRRKKYETLRLKWDVYWVVVALLMFLFRKMHSCCPPQPELSRNRTVKRADDFPTRDSTEIIIEIKCMSSSILCSPTTLSTTFLNEELSRSYEY